MKKAILCILSIFCILLIIGCGNTEVKEPVCEEKSFVNEAGEVIICERCQTNGVFEQWDCNRNS